MSASPARAALVDDRAAVARRAIEESEVRQRDVLSHLYRIDEELKSALKKSTELARRSRLREREARDLARETLELERLGSGRARQMNGRLGSLYRRRAHPGALGAMFAAESPARVDRQHRYLKLMIEDDRRQVEAYVAGLREARAKRAKLGASIRRLVESQREARAAESALAATRAEKARLVAEIDRRKNSRVDELRSLRDEGRLTTLTFAERRGALSGPARGPVARAFGAVNDPKFNFKLVHKGWFYALDLGSPVSSVAEGRVAVARDLPGYGPTVVIDHGAHYRSVYACASRIKVREGDVVAAGDLLAYSGATSPLFGPGLYFELRHFADAVDPRKWIKDANFTTAAGHQE